jgi:thiol-disulfide isomerase/thioredoxin
MPPAKTKKAPPRKAPPPKKQVPVVALVIGGVVLLAVIALVVSLVGGDDDGDGGAETAGFEQTQPVEIAGDPLPAFAQGPDPAVGVAAPVLDGASFDGSTVSIGDDGRAKVVMFLAHWCPHCQAEVPRLVAWLDENGAPPDVDIYAVSTGTDETLPNYPPSTWLEEEGLDVPTLADDADNSAGQAYGLSSFPYFVAIDANGDVAGRASGELTTDQWESLLALAAAT